MPKRLDSSTQADTANGVTVPVIGTLITIGFVFPLSEYGVTVSRTAVVEAVDVTDEEAVAAALDLVAQTRLGSGLSSASAAYYDDFSVVIGQ